jgi:hypothetical protein
VPAWEESEAVYWETGHLLHVVVRDIQILPVVFDACAFVLRVYGLRTPRSKTFRFTAPWDLLSVAENSVFASAQMCSWAVHFEPEWLAGLAKIAAEPVPPGTDKRYRLRRYYVTRAQPRWLEGVRESSFEEPRSE